jgi:hypothetical protein
MIPEAKLAGPVSEFRHSDTLDILDLDVLR